MGIEQIDIFRLSETEKQDLQKRISQSFISAKERINGAISSGHLEAMLTSVLAHEADVPVSDNMKMEIHLSVEAAGGNRNNVDYDLLASKIADLVEQRA